MKYTFKVLKDGQEHIASSIYTLKSWLREGKINEKDLVYHPILKQWIYVRDMAELQDELTGIVNAPKTIWLFIESFALILAIFGILAISYIKLAGFVIILAAILIFFYGIAMEFKESRATRKRKLEIEWKFRILQLMLAFITILVGSTIGYQSIKLQKLSLEKEEKKGQGKAIIYTIKNNFGLISYPKSINRESLEISPEGFCVKSDDVGDFYPGLYSEPIKKSFGISGSFSPCSVRIVSGFTQGAINVCIANIGGRIIQVKDIMFHINFEPSANLYHFPTKDDHPEWPIGAWGEGPEHIYELEIKLTGESQKLNVIEKGNYPDIGPNQKLVVQTEILVEKAGIYTIVVKSSWRDVDSSKKTWQEIESDSFSIVFNDEFHWKTLLENAQNIKMIVRGWDPYNTIKIWKRTAPKVEIIIEEDFNIIPNKTIELPDIPWNRVANFDTLCWHYGLYDYLEKEESKNTFIRIGNLPDSILNKDNFIGEIIIVNDSIALVNSSLYGAEIVDRRKYINKYLKFFEKKKLRKDIISHSEEKHKILIYSSQFKQNRSFLD